VKTERYPADSTGALLPHKDGIALHGRMYATYFAD